MNFGRTIPHAILTIYLLEAGLTLAQIAYLQIIYMIAIMLFEIPSGYFSDRWSRKYMYIFSIIFLTLAYVLIYLGYSNLYLLMFAWFLYGLSAALNSGTMESELINQIKASNNDIKKLVIWNSYIASISSAVGAIMGSLLYINIGSEMYLITFICFIISLILALLFKVNVETKNNIQGNVTSKPFLKNTIVQLLKDRSTQEIIVAFTLISLFIQPYYQYWQVLFMDKGIPIAIFGIAFVVFQICNVLGAYIYGRINYNDKHSIYVLIVLTILTIITLLNDNPVVFLILFMAVLTLFYIYFQDLSVKLRERSSETNISTLNSLVGTFMNFSSIFVLAAFSVTIEYFSLYYNYIIYFTLFYIFSIVCVRLYAKKTTTF